MDSWKAQSPWFQQAHKLGFAVHSATITQVPRHGHTTLELAYVEQGTIEEVFNHPKEAYTKQLLAAAE